MVERVGAELSSLCTLPWTHQGSPCRMLYLCSTDRNLFPRHISLCSFPKGPPSLPHPVTSRFSFLSTTRSQDLTHAWVLLLNSGLAVCMGISWVHTFCRLSFREKILKPVIFGISQMRESCLMRGELAWGIGINNGVTREVYGIL